ncbi:ImmA/IrrE family metallo-endopeptidase [Chromobacterium amazonense]|uniref:ImmA/IrrE family metallo-endopeptidase n=1 Tax=Chromobacterium amazonense TaxID=1382803 RepID=UPI003F7AE68B
MTDIALANFDKLLAGEPSLTFNQLKKLAEFFGRGVLFFLEQAPVDDAAVRSPQFRTLANQKPELSARIKMLIERVEHQRAVYLMLRDEVEDGHYPRFTPPRMDGLTPKQAAAAARVWLGLGPTNNFESYRQAVEACGLLVFRSNGYNGKWQIAKESPILGFSLYDTECPVIVVKKQVADAQQVFTLMHELGHLLLHCTSSIDDDADMHAHSGKEQEANAFAGHLLVPDEFLIEIPDRGRPDNVAFYDDWLAEYRKRWGVSSEVLLRRLMDSHRLSRECYVAYRQWRNALPIEEKDGGNRAYRHREPKHVFGDVYVRTVLSALSGKRISLAKACNYLDNLKVKDIHLLEQHYAGV